ncbi:7726_t:CDS:1, partial [Dentiscutata erythropus]
VLPLTSKSGSNSATQISSSQNEVQEGVKDQVVVQDPEAGPGPATQIYREEQTIIQEVKYAPENYFRSIYEIEDGVIEKEPPTKNIEFLERRPDPNRQHQNLNSITVWE